MNREQKAAAIEEIAQELIESEAVVAVNYRGVTVSQAAELRGKLREADARLRVVKNRLTLRATEKAGASDLDELLTGPTALTLIKGDMAAAAKALADFSSEHEALQIKGGLMDGAAIDASQIGAIAKLPSRDVLNGQLVGVVSSPLSGLVRTLNALVGGLASQLGQIRDQGLVGGDAPEPEAPAEEPAADQAAVDPDPGTDEPAAEGADDDQS
ncbi:MAG: 50S ribosomal protein L10 [Solirubrobacterales bacterium]